MESRHPSYYVESIIEYRYGSPGKGKKYKGPSCRDLFLSYLWTYDLYGPVRNAFDVGRYITTEVDGPGNQDFFVPCETTSCS